MGPIRWVTRDGQRVAYRDWMTDPGDVHTLLRWSGGELDIQYRATETELERFSFDPRELPVLLLAGHDAFELSDDIRRRLAAYVLAGGTILGDACCGWEPFAEAFRREMAAIFPGRPLRKLLPDHPVHAAYNPIEQLTYKRADGSTFTDLPCLEGINVGCRTAVLFSPIDLTCGWDGHEHPRGLRVVINEARRLGANMLTYILAMYPLGRFLAASTRYREPTKLGEQESTGATRDDFVFAQVVHCGDWDPDPSAADHLLRHVRDNSTVPVKFGRLAVDLSKPDELTCPLLYMTGHWPPEITEQEADRLRRYLRAGGMLLADACCGRLAFDTAFRQLMARVLPGSPLEPLPADHQIYRTHYQIDSAAYTPRVAHDFGPTPELPLEGITLDGRLAVVYSRFDLGNGWEQFTHPYSYGILEGDALKLGTNAIVYAMTH